uniref:Uncharacterized protein n=1 Tax=Micromonas pusilla TaxID=38833 RepID=A0A7R9T6G3_MICPS|mmetsp:Transcript_10058/g.36491  ORF Transcript_10058/g.36491 Transcript_10058/m.36491 type:complete len:112 (+) Transcript_10058:1992-2327(+)
MSKNVKNIKTTRIFLCHSNPRPVSFKEHFALDISGRIAVHYPMRLVFGEAIILLNGTQVLRFRKIHLEWLAKNIHFMENQAHAVFTVVLQGNALCRLSLHLEFPRKRKFTC